MSTAVLEAYWNFKGNKVKEVSDLSGNEKTLFASGDLHKNSEDDLIEGVKLNGDDQWLSTVGPVVRTDSSFSVVAWVYLDGEIMNKKLALRSEEHSFALTAVSQDSPTHCSFYLGVRRIEEYDENNNHASSLKWTFTIAPIDGSETGSLHWRYAHSKSSLKDSGLLNKWVLLIGICDVKSRSAQLYIPELSEYGIVHVPDEWTFWHADGGLQIGRAKWLGRNVDQWPGKIGPIRIFSGILSLSEIAKLSSLEFENLT